MNAKDILSLIAEGESYIEVIKEAIPVLEKAGVEIRPFLESLTDNVVDLQARAFERYVKAGFSREEALILTLSLKVAMAESQKRNKA